MDIFEMYMGEMSIPEISEKTSIPLSTIRFRLKKAGILRTATEGIRIAGKKGRMSRSSNLGKKFSDEWKNNISKAKLRHGDLNADGVRITSSGYVEFTRGENKGRSVHVVAVEKRLGRKLYKDECVHHIDGDKENNQDNNLCLMTVSGHIRLHRILDIVSGKERERNTDGRFS